MYCWGRYLEWLGLYLWAPLTFEHCAVLFEWDTKGSSGEDCGDVGLAFCQPLPTVFGMIPSLSLDGLGSIIGSFIKRQS